LSGITSAMVGPADPGILSPAMPDVSAFAARVAAGRAEEQPDGGVDIVLAEEPGEPVPPQVEWFGNLAEHIDGSMLSVIAAEVLDGIEADETSNEAYFEDVAAIIALLGLRPEARDVDDKLFAGASDIIHPMMLNAIVRFVANGRAEMLPAAGPARSRIEGTPTQPFEEQAQRRQRYLNYHLTTEDAGWYADYEGGLLRLAIYGSLFRKVFRDPVTNEVRSRFLTPAHFLVSYYAPSLDAATRATHIDLISSDEVLRRVLSGYYIDAGQVSPGMGEDAPGQAVIAAGDNRTRSDRTEDAEHTHYHCQCWHTLAGTPFEHIGEDGEPDGLPLPVIVTVDRDAQRVLRIERDWVEGQPPIKRRQSVVHYLFHPGLGFYGWGLGALMRGPTDQASALWRLAIDQMQLNAFPGGFKARGTKTDDSSVTIGPGEFQEIETNGRPIRDAIMSLGEVYRDVPASWAPIFESVVTVGQQLGMTTEMQTGEGRPDAPVGTTLALIEQAIRPEAAVFKRLHHGMSQELRLFCAEFAKEPGAQYPYVVDGKKGVALGADFADAADIVPVSDPNQPTQVQRLAAAEGVYKLSLASGGMMDTRAALSDVLRTMGKSQTEIQALMPQPGQGKPADVATEFAFALKGMPLAVGPTQDHAAHAQAHIAQMQTPGLPPPIMSALLAHIGEHVAAGYWLLCAEAAAAQGMQLSPPGQPMPPEMEAAMARAVAASSEQIVATLAQALGGGAGDDGKAAELELKRQELAFKQQDAERKSQESARQEQGEALRTAQDAATAEAERTARLQEALIGLEGERVRAAAAMSRGAGRGLPL
jgi:hypothetical protein